MNNEKSIDVWGDGEQTRSFLYIDDCINAIIKLAERVGLKVIPNRNPMSFSEDFAHLSNRFPGCFFLLGNGEKEPYCKPLHSSDYDFNDDLLEIGSKFSLMSSAFIETPIGSVPKQESFEVEGIFNTGFYEFDQNFVFLNLSDALAIFDKSVFISFSLGRGRSRIVRSSSKSFEGLHNPELIIIE